MSESSQTQTIIKFPDLISPVPFTMHINPLTEEVSIESDAWMVDLAKFNEEQRRKFAGLNAGLLCGMCYARCGRDELRVCTDFMSFLFNLDDWTDEFDTTGTKGVADCVMNTLYHPHTFHSDAVAARLTKSFWLRMLQTVGPRCHQRFMSTLDTYFQAIMQQAADRAQNNIPELEEYITLRRDTSGCKTGFALIEYATHIDLPNEVADHPVILDLLDSTNDIISWSNDILSYNIEQSRGQYHNLIPSIMATKNVDLQAAMEYGGDLVKQSIERFLGCKASLPSWGEEVDRDVAIYIQGCEDWIIANGLWSFETKRYFGEKGMEVKKTLQVALLPPRTPRP